MRGEVGYTEADVDEFVLDVLGEPLELSFTTLPNYYRFKAGGSMSVRGYGFEQLSNNDIGSNHIITASAETEYRFLENWSGAAFFDIGNAFNDWNDPDLKRGAGIGIRWYSIAGEIRVDVAQAIDFEGNEIGTDTIQITSTATELPLRDVLRISEINYHPQDASDGEPNVASEQFEFIELT